MIHTCIALYMSNKIVDKFKWTYNDSVQTLNPNKVKNYVSQSYQDNHNLDNITINNDYDAS